MRRFRWGATNRPLLKRPGSGYGRMSYGAPGPTQEVEPRQDIVPEMFTENSENPVVRTTFARDFETKTTIDLTSD